MIQSAPHRRRLAVHLAAGLAFFALGGACTPAVEVPDPADILAARQAALAFEVQLNTEVLDRLATEDPVAVYMAYRDHAAGFAGEISERSGLELTRTAMHVRNPANAPDDWELKQLAMLQFSMDGGLDAASLEASGIVEEADGRRVFRWIKPVAMGETCMACHGDAIDPRILRLLAQDYPLDEATGYFEYEMRGAYSVRRIIE